MSSTIRSSYFSLTLIIFIGHVLSEPVDPSRNNRQYANDNNDKLELVARKSNDAMSISSLGDDPNVINTKSVRCSICNSIAREGLTDDMAKMMGAVGSDCINNPQKFMKDCDQWRANFGYNIAGSVNKTVRFTGCYKTVISYEHDVEGNKKPEDRVVRSCGFLGKPGCFKAPGHGTNQRICFCTEPECNGSSNLIPTLIVLLALSISSILIH